jgi:acyl-CoA thioesterase-1
MTLVMRRGQPLALALLAVALACGGTSPTGPGDPGTQPPPVVVAFGDSLTAGPGIQQSQTYPALLQQRIRSAGLPHVVLNRGVSGDTTADGVRRLESALVPDTRVFILELGANDGLQGLSVADMRNNLRTIIETVQRRNIRILLCGMEAPPVRSVQYSLEFHQVFPDLAQQYNLPLMPFLLTGVFGNPDLNLLDGLHPNAAGHRVIADNMWPYLEPLLR